MSELGIQNVVLANPRGFCAGVDRAIKVVEDCLELFGAPVYVKHEIIHNKHEVARLKDLGAITVEQVSEIPEGATAVFSAHGSPPEHYQQAKERNLNLIDATCPLVTKVHLEVHRYIKEGYQIVYIGHKEHVEGIGVRGEAPNTIPLIETVEDVEKLELDVESKVVYLTQTTLSIDDTAQIITELKNKFPNIAEPPKEDICYATTNRQAAIKDLAKEVDIILVVGSKNSSNSNRLVETARFAGVDGCLIDDVSDINSEWFKGKKIVGISGGASAPERKVQEVVTFFTDQGAKIDNLKTMDEEVFFPEPIELKQHKKKQSI